jgi:hypothetical protein
MVKNSFMYYSIRRTTTVKSQSGRLALGRIAHFGISVPIILDGARWAVAAYTLKGRFPRHYYPMLEAILVIVLLSFLTVRGFNSP